MNLKKYDPASIIIIFVIVSLIFSWNYIFGPSGLNLLPQAQTKIQRTTAITKKQNKNNKIPITNRNNIKKQYLPIENNNRIKISNNNYLEKGHKGVKKYNNLTDTSPDGLITITVNPSNGGIKTIALNKIKDSNNKNIVILGKNIKHAILSLSSKENHWMLINIAAFKKTDNQIFLKRVFEANNGSTFAVIQRWKPEKDYVISYSLSIENLSNRILNIPNMYIWAGEIPPVEFVSGDYARMESQTIDMLLIHNKKIITIKANSDSLKSGIKENDPIKWLSISDMYFAYIIKTIEGNINGGSYCYSYKITNTINSEKKSGIVIGAAAIIKNLSIEKMATKKFKLSFYCGPKDIQLLAKFAPNTKEILHLMSWPILRTISEWLLYALIYLKNIVGNFGLAIILLTIIIKIIFWPITHKSTQSMKKMQKLQPKIKELKGKYKDNKQLLNQKMMELYKEEKVNPLGGCLPILIQIPIFIALYYTLMGAFEIRHASFLWATDLTKPDTIGHILGIPINPLAIFMAITMLIQQKLTPTATDPAQAKMMLLMPLIMLIFLYSLPSGLTLYWTVSQLISIIQLLYNKYSDNLKGKVKAA